jgi:hypothetical protein
MSQLIRARGPVKTPIERIFEKVMHRKMTSQERVYFHLKRQIKRLRKTKASKSKQPRAA